MGKAVQYFTDEYLEHCKKMSVQQIMQFLDSYRLLSFEPGKLQRLNMRMPENTLIAFKEKAKREGVSYQQKIRELMTQWVVS